MQSIVMCCDFFYPRIGGVEQHIWSLSQHLRSLGHNVAIITGRYVPPGGGGGDAPRVGVRYMSCGLRVYHLPHLPMADQSSFPTYFGLLPLLRALLLRERHGHTHTHQPLDHDHAHIHDEHHQHAHECDCPPVEELDFDPYTTRSDSTLERK